MSVRDRNVVVLEREGNELREEIKLISRRLEEV